MDLIETGHHEVNANRDPDLGSNGVVRRPEERLDTEVLLDPLEEEFDPPAALVDCRHGESRKIEMIGQEYETLSRSRIDVADTTQFFGISAFPFSRAQSNRLIAAQSGCFVDRAGLQNREFGVGFGSDDEVSHGRCDTVKPCEIEVASVKNIDASRLDGDLVEKVDIVDRPLRNPDKNRDGAGEVDLRVHFDRRFGAAKTSPGKHRQAQIDSRGIDGINHLFEVQTVGVFGIEPSSLANEHLTQGFVNPPVPMLVRIGEVRSCNVAAKAHSVSVSTTTQAGFDVAQALAESNLSESHREKLIAGGHALARSWHPVQRHAAIELLSVNEIGDLGEDQTSGVHPLLRMDTGGSGQPVQMRHTVFSSLATQNQLYAKPKTDLNWTLVRSRK